MFDCSKFTALKALVKRNLLPILTVVSVVTGIVLGIILRYSRDGPWSPREVMYVGYIGELYLRALKCLIIPLITSSIISAIGNLDFSLSRKIAGRAISYYLTTTAIAVVLGIFLVVTIHPGGGSKDIKKTGEKKEVYTADLLMDIPRNLLPPNIIQAAFQTYKTIIIPPDMESNDTQYLVDKYDLAPGDLPPKHEWKTGSKYQDAMNIMGLLVFATALGISLSKLGKKGKPLLDVFHSLADASMMITGWVIWISPLGILFLITSMMIKMNDLSTLLGQVGMHILTVCLGITIHGFIILPGIYMILTRKLPFRFIGNMSQALITAFATATSSGTLPVTMRCLEENNNIDPRITRFVLPIGATINMDGTALYEAVSAIFIAQVRGIPLTIGQIAAISLTSTVASIGAAGIPHAGLVTLVMVLDVAGLPAEDITLIIAADWLIDRFRTAINVLGDSFGAAIVYEMSRKELGAIDDKKTLSSEEKVANVYKMVDNMIENGEDNHRTREYHMLNPVESNVLINQQLHTKEVL
ncbi:unnamed protein product [Meganyctiphanes norvegica]|uniref:Amino acid transporter n=1 Tax=Meganyctiphanes norvegica TaxID=48144 RepID=A0AAV2SNR8_MEGNR